MNALNYTNYQKLINIKSIPSGILVYGISINVILESILHWSRYLLCYHPIDNSGCNNCASCILFNNSTHPNIDIVTAEDEENITVDRIRELNSYINISNNITKNKIIIIPDASKLNYNAFNALLKTLEELPKNVLLIIINNNLNEIPDTIKSRCFKIKFSPIIIDDSNKYLLSEIKEKGNIDFWLNFYDYDLFFDYIIDENIIEALVSVLIKPNINNILIVEEHINKYNINFNFILEFLMKWLINLIYLIYYKDLLYFNAHKIAIEAIVKHVNIKEVFYLLDKIYYFNHYNNRFINIKLQTVNLLFEYQQLILNQH